MVHKLKYHSIGIHELIQKTLFRLDMSYLRININDKLIDIRNRFVIVYAIKTIKLSICNKFNIKLKYFNISQYNIANICIFTLFIIQ